MTFSPARRVRCNSCYDQSELIVYLAPRKKRGCVLVITSSSLGPTDARLVYAGRYDQRIYVTACEEKFSSVNFHLSYSNIKSIVLYAEVQHKKLDFRYVLYSVDTLDCI